MIRVIAHELVFVSPPTPECHASTVAAMPDGTLIVAWFGGTHEKHPDVGIWLARRSLSGTWTAPKRVAKLREEAHWNPVLLEHRGKLHLWFKVGATIPHWQTWTMVSGDGGLSWSEARQVVPGDDAGGRGPVKNKPLVLADGTWLAGASTEQGTWEAFFDRSTDGGVTWTRTPNLDRKALGTEHGLIQPTVWESSPGKVHALLRSSCGFAPRTDSVDGGKTWSPVYATRVPNNNSGLDLARLADGTLALAHNPVSKNWGPRTPLRVALSHDNGATWPDFIDLETGEGEFSYPAALPVGPRRVAITYTKKRREIAFALLELEPK